MNLDNTRQCNLRHRFLGQSYNTDMSHFKDNLYNFQKCLNCKINKFNRRVNSLVNLNNIQQHMQRNRFLGQNLNRDMNQLTNNLYNLFLNSNHNFSTIYHIDSIKWHSNSNLFDSLTCMFLILNYNKDIMSQRLSSFYSWQLQLHCMYNIKRYNLSKCMN